MAGQQFFDVLAQATTGTKGPTNVTRIAADANGNLIQSIKGAPYTGLGSGSAPSGSETRMFEERAQAVISGPFQVQNLDYYGAATSTGNGGAIGVAVTNVQSETGARVRYAVSGAGSIRVTSGSTEDIGGTANAVYSQMWSQWHLECRARMESISGITATTAAVLVGLMAPSGPFGLTDAASGIYVAFGVRGDISTTNYCVWAWDAVSLKTHITPWPIELQIDRRFGFSNCSGYLYSWRDGVGGDQFAFDNQLSSAGAMFRGDRGGGASYSLLMDAWRGAFA